MRRFIIAAAAAALAVTPTFAHAAIVADFELNGSLANSAGTAAALVNNGATLGATGLTFAARQGPTVTGLTALAAYTIDTSFYFNDSGRYFKIADLSGLQADTGFYSYFQQLSFYPTASTAAPVFTPGTATRLTLSRTAGGLVTGYVNGTSVLTYDDSTSGYFVFTGPLAFFQDDSATGGNEADGGYVDYLRVYDAAITPAQALPATPTGPTTPAVPEPSTWAMLLVGFAMVGAVARYRRRGAVALSA